MAKACAYLCRQCCFIDGFGEFGENVYSEENILVQSRDDTKYDHWSNEIHILRGLRVGRITFVTQKVKKNTAYMKQLHMNVV